MELKIEPLDIQNNKIISALLKWENDEELYHLTIPKKKDCVWTKQNFESLQKKYTDNSKNNSAIYIIFDQNKPIGNYSLQMNPDHLLKKGEETSWPGLTIGEKEYWGKGIASKAISLIIDKARDEYNLKKLTAGVAEKNEASKRVLEKNGFKLEGKKENHLIYNGVWMKQYDYGLLL